MSSRSTRSRWPFRFLLLAAVALAAAAGYGAICADWAEAGWRPLIPALVPAALVIAAYATDRPRGSLALGFLIGLVIGAAVFVLAVAVLFFVNILHCGVGIFQSGTST